MAKKKRRMRKRSLVIGCIVLEVVVVLAVIGILAVYLNGGWKKETGAEGMDSGEAAEDPFEVALTRYMDAVLAGDYEGMYEAISAQNRGQIGEEAFLERNRNIYEGIGLESLEIEISEAREVYQQEEENSKILYYDTRMVTAAGEISFSNRVTVNRYEEKYLLEWNSGLIFPELEAGDRVAVQRESGSRGSVYDRNGVLLAGNGFVVSVGLVPGKMQEDSRRDLEDLSELLGVTVEDIETRLAAEWVTEDTFVPVKSISASEQELAQSVLEIDGVMTTEEAARVYPLGKAAAHLTGYIQSVSQDELEALEEEGRMYTAESKIGKAGVESLFEERLREQEGIKIAILDGSGSEKKILAKVEAKDGEDIYLTIDAQIQGQIYEQLAEDKSTTVVMNPYTGEVLALSSTPGYDPNDFILGMTQDTWEGLSEDERQPMYNRFRANAVPGSSIKPVIAAMALHTGTLSAEDNLGYSGTRWQKDDTWGGYYITTLVDYGSEVTMEHALIHSDNIYFAKAALQMGPELTAEQFERLGFGETLPFIFGLSESSYGEEDALKQEVVLADTGYGQASMQVNPVHLASIYSAFVNEGSMIWPYLEHQEDLSIKFWKESVFTADAAAGVRDMLVQVVENPQGSGHEAKVNELTIGGKTGTAEIKDSQDDHAGTELGWFCAFNTDRDTDKPYLAVSMVEDVKDRGGSHYVIPVVRSLFIEE